MAEDHDGGMSRQQQQQQPQQQPQQRPAQTPTGTQGFFTTLLSPLYSSPRHLPPRDSNVNFDAHTTSSVSSQDFLAGRSSTTTTPSASPTTTSPSSRQATGAAAAAAEMNSAPLSLAAASAGVDEQRHFDAHSNGTGISNSGSGARPRGGVVANHYRFSNAAIAPTDLHKAGMLNTVDAAGTNYNSNNNNHNNNNNFVEAQKNGGQGHAAPPTSSTAAQASPLQHGSGACAPHMLGYRQCLEVNPDFKTNCTWALDNYMRCKEDTEL